jgi:hypothetical protein
MTKEESIQHLNEIRAELARLAGEGRKAQVQTFGGWLDADQWTPYGIGKPNSPDKLTIEFRWDAERSILREMAEGSADPLPNHALRELAPGSNFFVLGLWPVQFVEVEP